MMISLLIRLLTIPLLIAFIFISLSLWRGGDLFRNTGDFISRVFHQAGQKADRIYRCRKGCEEYCQKIHSKVPHLLKKDNESTDKGK